MVPPRQLGVGVCVLKSRSGGVGGKAVLTSAVRREEGLITVKMRWKEYAPHVLEEEAYKAVEANTSGSRPKVGQHSVRGGAGGSQVWVKGG